MIRTVFSTMAALCLGAVLPAGALAGGSYDDWRAFFGEVESVPTPSCVATTRAGRVSLHLAATPVPERPPEVYTVQRYAVEHPKRAQKIPD